MKKIWLIYFSFVSFLMTENVCANDGGLCFPAHETSRVRGVYTDYVKFDYSPVIGLNMRWICDEGIMNNFSDGITDKNAITTQEIYQMGYRIAGVHTAGSPQHDIYQKIIPYIIIEKGSEALKK